MSEHAEKDAPRLFTADEVIQIANETSDSLGNLYRLDFIDRIRHEARPLASVLTDLPEPKGNHCPGCGWSSGGHDPKCPMVSDDHRAHHARMCDERLSVCPICNIDLAAVTPSAKSGPA